MTTTPTEPSAARDVSPRVSHTFQLTPRPQVGHPLRRHTLWERLVPALQPPLRRTVNHKTAKKPPVWGNLVDASRPPIVAQNVVPSVNGHLFGCGGLRAAVRHAHMESNEQYQQ
ncbi:hypothetical protein E4U14_008400 [Claviceps sp. LM454 group G7]|nr:hypothetical protein E4U14_008400 [Claviceps sp. LM454 group G7]